jgi:hypothetical protein
MQLSRLARRTLLAPRDLHTKEEGQVLGLFVLIFAVIGGMTAIAIDLGSFSADRRDLQNAADAIALAAAQELPDHSAVHATADEWAEKNGVDSDGMAVEIIDQSASEPNPKVRVELSEEHEFVFARLVGIESGTVEAAAVALRTSPGGIYPSSGALVPWSVTQEVRASTEPSELVVLKYDANSVTTGNFGAIRIDGNGSSVYRDTIKFGSDSGLCAAGVEDCDYPSTVPSEPGNMVGSTETGTDYRMDNTSELCDEWDEVVTEVDGEHMLNASCNPFLEGGNPNSLQVVIVPIISSLCNGACDVTVLEFALFFLEGYGEGGCSGNDCEIAGRFINSNTNIGAFTGSFAEGPNTLNFVRLVE